MNIGQFTDTFIPVVDGVGRVVSAYCGTLAEMGHEVTAIAPLADTGYRGGYPFELIDYIAGAVPGAKQYKTGATFLDPHYQIRIKMVPFEIVHAHSPFMAGLEALRIAHKHDIPLVATFHSKYYDDFVKATGSKVLAHIGVRTIVEFYDHCDEVWAVSQSTADTLADYGYRGDIQIMPNGTFLREPSPESVKAVNEKWQLGEGSVLLFVGQQNFKKNILRVLESCALLKKRGMEFTLVLAGQGPDEREIERKIEELGICEVVRVVGHVSDPSLLEGLYERADLFVFPSLYDNAPMVVREAAAARTPSVLVRGSTASEIINENVNGLLCEDDSEDLCRVLLAALSDKERIAALGECARSTIPMDWKKIMEGAVERYASLIERAKHGALPKKSLEFETWLGQ